MPEQTPTSPPQTEPPEQPESDSKRARDRFLQQPIRVIIEQVGSVLVFVWDLIRTLALTVRALILVVLKTPFMLVPSSAHTSMQDDKYNKALVNTLNAHIDALPDLDAGSKGIIKAYWVDQIEWTGNRATRERDANELIRWWQIILGVLIPVLVQVDIPEDQKKWLVTIFGIFVAVLTAIAQFRRPEERWRHFRVVHERYLNEMWNFLALAAEYRSYSGEKGGHQAAFPEFYTRMSAVKSEEVGKFFAEVVPPKEAAQVAEQLAVKAAAQAAPPPDGEAAT